MGRTLQTLVAGLRDGGDSPAMIAFSEHGMSTWSYAELHDRTRRLAAAILDEVAEPGERVAVIGPNSADVAALRLAIVAAGVVAVPLDELATTETLRASIAGSGAVALFAAREVLEKISPVLPAAVKSVFALDDPGDTGARPMTSLSRDPSAAFPESLPDDLAAIIYTSGTTGAAKGVPLTHANFLANIDAFAEAGFAGPADRILMPLPLHHAYPFMAGLMVPLACRSAVILPASVSGPDIATALKEGAATIMVGVPRIYEAIADGIRARLKSGGFVSATIFGGLLWLSIALRRRFGIHAGRWLMRPVRARFAPRLRLMGSGGAKLAEEAAWTLEGLGFEVLTGYGLVETSSVSTFNRKGRGRIGTEGQPGAGVELRIDSPDEEGVGEIQIRGPHVFAGYYNDPEATAAAFTDDGWFRSGDLGHLDDTGAVVVVGRSKEVIVLAGGKNIGPELVEQALTTSPFIEDAAVLERKGDLVALVKPDINALQAAGTARVEELMRIAVTESCVDLAPYQRVTGFRIWRQPLPKTRLGKLQRFTLPDLYDAAEQADTARPAELTDEDRALMEQPTARRVMESLANRFPDQTITLDTSPQLDLGVDSLGWIEIAHELETESGVTLSEDMLAEVVTVRDLLRQTSQGTREAAADAPPVPAPSTRASRALGWLIYALNWCLMRAAFRVSAVGALPRDPKRFLLVANHNSDLDALLVAAAFPWRFARCIWWGADVTRLFTTRLRRAFSRAAQVFPVDDRRPSMSLDQAQALLERDESMVWFPESWRSADGRLQNFSRGIGILIDETRPTVVPVWITGSFEALPRHRRWPRFVRVTVRFGDPVSAEALMPAQEVADRADDIAKAARALVAELGTQQIEAGPHAAAEEPERAHGEPRA